MKTILEIRPDGKDKHEMPDYVFEQIMTIFATSHKMNMRRALTALSPEQARMIVTTKLMGRS